MGLCGDCSRLLVFIEFQVGGILVCWCVLEFVACTDQSGTLYYLIR